MFYELLFLVSIMAFAGDCDDMLIFILWHAFWGIMAVFSGHMVVREAE